MSKPLTEREKIVLHAIVRSPSGTDRELAEEAGLKQTTFTAIRRRLKDNGYYSTVRIPSIRELGGEIFAVTYGHYKTAVPMDIRLITGRRLVEAHKEVFWAGSEYSQAVSFQLARTFTEARTNMVELEQFYMAQGFLGEAGVTFVAFPFDMAEFPFFFDYEPLIRQSFGLAGDGKPAGLPRGRPGARMGASARKTYHGLIQSPELNDRELGEAIGTSQRSVAKFRSEFEQSGMFKTVAIPSLQRLDFRMLAFDHAKLNLGIPEKQRRETLEALAAVKAPIMMGIAGDDVIALTAYEDFGVFRRSINSFSEVYKQDDIFIKEPKRMLFSIPEMEMLKNHVYGPVVAKLLGL